MTGDTVSVITGESDTLVVIVHGGIKVLDQNKADAAVAASNNAIETVAAERPKLGAMQNRL